MQKKIFFFVTFALACALALVILIHPNRELDQDLGRHIKLGEIIWQTRQIPRTNLFSYTHSDFPFLNHHWGSEVVFYLISKSFGILAISYLKIAILFAAILLVLLAAKKSSSWPAALLTSTLFLPLLIPRTLERPEIFGYFFFCLYLWLYSTLRVKTSSTLRVVWIVPLVQLLWINLHLTFVYGFLLLAIFTADAWGRGEWKKAQSLAWITLASVVASLINPHGLQGLLYPLRIFRNYGYSIQENQNLFFLGSLTSNIFLPTFWVVAGVSVFVCAIAMYRTRKSLGGSILHMVLLGVFGILAIMAYRNIPFFVFAGVVSTSFFLNQVLGKKAETALSVGASVMALVVIFLITSGWFYNTFDLDKKITLEVKEQYHPGVEFFIAHDLRGPIFNNFDIGGYLDYRLYPKTQVFVDNRPEAYPVEFFDEYKSGQQDISKTAKLLKKYNIETIIFSHTDGTPWGIEFVRNLPTFEEYKIVYLDWSVAIAVKKQSGLPAITDKDLDRLVQNEEDYRSLISLYYLLRSWEKNELAQTALEKAYSLNPDSCGGKLQMGLAKIRSPHRPVSKQGKEILSSVWYCPYPPYIREGLRGVTSDPFL